MKTGPIRFIEKDVLDTFQPDWTYVVPADADVTNYYRHYMHDPRDPTGFYLYPRPDPEIPVWVQYAKLPELVDDAADTFPLSDAYLNAAVIYVTYRALNKEGRFAAGPDSRAAKLYQEFLGALGMSRKVAYEVGTDMNPPPGGAS
jgi:hypothetical protein